MIFTDFLASGVAIFPRTIHSGAVGPIVRFAGGSWNMATCAPMLRLSDQLVKLANEKSVFCLFLEILRQIFDAGGAKQTRRLLRISLGRMLDFEPIYANIA